MATSTGAGYIYCACRDCFEITIGTPGELCDDCEQAGCYAWPGEEKEQEEAASWPTFRHNYECQREDFELEED
jgi:hypothetical protein